MFERHPGGYSWDWISSLDCGCGCGGGDCDYVRFGAATAGIIVLAARGCGLDRFGSELDGGCSGVFSICCSLSSSIVLVQLDVLCVVLCCLRAPAFA